MVIRVRNCYIDIIPFERSHFEAAIWILHIIYNLIYVSVLVYVNAMLPYSNHSSLYLETCTFRQFVSRL